MQSRTQKSAKRQQSDKLRASIIAALGKGDTDKAERASARRLLAAKCAGAVLQTDGLLRLPEVLALVPVSPSTWWAGVQSGRFPFGVKLGPRCRAWPAAEIRDLLARLTAESGQ
ncbi:MAG: AlpA family phage regulatory protein [Xanthomonadales bacterium]|nr:AlpA family phage regulatory protein [Xanthomonadales bacterium]